MIWEWLGEYVIFVIIFSPNKHFDLKFNSIQNANNINNSIFTHSFMIIDRQYNDELYCIEIILGFNSR